MAVDIVSKDKKAAYIQLIDKQSLEVVRTLDDKAIEGLRRSADRYVVNWQRFVREMKQIG